MDAPQLRIVSNELFASVQRRFRTVKQMVGREGSGLAVRPKRYLFSWLLKCGQCGGSIALVSGRGRHGADRYGCSLNPQRENSICTNTLLVRRDELGESLLCGLAESALRTEGSDYVVAKLEDFRNNFKASTLSCADSNSGSCKSRARLAGSFRRLQMARRQKVSWPQLLNAKANSNL